MMQEINFLLVSLLCSDIEITSLRSDNDTIKKYDIGDFCLSETDELNFLKNSESEYKFKSFHYKLLLDIDPFLKIKFVELVVEQIKIISKKEFFDRLFILIPNDFPEWLLSKMRIAIVEKKLSNCIIIREYLIKILQKNDLSKKKSNQIVEHISALIKEYKSEDIVRLLAKISQNSFDEIVLYWDLTLGLFIDDNEWIELLNNNEILPVKKNLNFKISNSAKEDNYLKLFAKEQDKHLIEISSLKIPHDELPNDTNYQMEIEFTYCWSGFLKLYKQDKLCNKTKINMPLIFYNN